MSANILDALLAAIFLAASGATALLVRRKISLLMQVPPHLIEASFTTRPSRIARSAGPVFEFFSRGRIRELYYAALVHSLHRLRLWLLRLERLVYRLLEGLQARTLKLSKTEERYWGTLKQWKHEPRPGGQGLPDAVFNPEPPPQADREDHPADGTPA